MSKKMSSIICLIIGSLSLSFLYYNSHDLIFTIIGILLAVVGVIIAITNLIVKENSNKRLYYYIIVVIGICFLSLGLII